MAGSAAPGPRGSGQITLFLWTPISPPCRGEREIQPAPEAAGPKRRPNVGRGAWLRSCKHCKYRLHHRSRCSLGIRGVSPTRSQNYRSCVPGRQGVVSYAHAHAHLLREAPRCRPLSGPQLQHKSDEPGFLTLKGGEGVRAEGRPEAFLSAGPQSCSQAGGAGSGLAARRIPPCQLLGWLSPARASHSVPPGSLGTQGWTHGHGGPRMEGAVADRLGDLGHVLSSSRASVHQL